MTAFPVILKPVRKRQITCLLAMLLAFCALPSLSVVRIADVAPVCAPAKRRHQRSEYERKPSETTPIRVANANRKTAVFAQSAFCVSPWFSSQSRFQRPPPASLNA